MRIAGICNVDVPQAFLQAAPKEMVLVCMPKGCGALSGKVVRLDRSLYGLNQASRSGHKPLVTRLKGLGFKQTLSGAFVFRSIEAGSDSVIAVVHVDGILAIGRIRDMWPVVGFWTT